MATRWLLCVVLCGRLACFITLAVLASRNAVEVVATGASLGYMHHPGGGYMATSLVGIHFGSTGILQRRRGGCFRCFTGVSAPSLRWLHGYVVGCRVWCSAAVWLASSHWQYLHFATPLRWLLQVLLWGYASSWWWLHGDVGGGYSLRQYRHLATPLRWLLQVLH